MRALKRTPKTQAPRSSSGRMPRERQPWWHQHFIRRDSSGRWEETDPVLEDGEMAYDVTANKLKIGDGTSRWSELLYVGS